MREYWKVTSRFFCRECSVHIVKQCLESEGKICLDHVQHIWNIRVGV